MEIHSGWDASPLQGTLHTHTQTQTHTHSFTSKIKHARMNAIVPQLGLNSCGREHSDQ